jgi:glycosyltransferase involved in cell wall biosynthesis
MPLVTVLMPVYNAEKYLPEAIESVLAQTYKDFVLLAVDDGSTDSTAEILNAYSARDARLTILSLPHAGIIEALNAGLAAAQTKYVARMDGDDICKPERLEVQIGYLESHPECALVGCSYVNMDADGDPLCVTTNPLTHEEIDAELLCGRSHVVIHPSVIFRTDAVRRIGGYRLQYGEDIDLFLRLAETARLNNVPDVLMYYRQHLQSTSISAATRHRFMETARSAAVASRRRRGLPETWKEDGTFTVLTRVEQQAMWSYKAMHGKNFRVARKHACAVIRRVPWRLQYWRLLAAACARSWFDRSASLTT